MLRLQLFCIKKPALQWMTQLVKNCPWVHVLSTSLDRVHRIECCLLSRRVGLTRVVHTVSRLHDVSDRVSGPSLHVGLLAHSFLSRDNKTALGPPRRPRREERRKTHAALRPSASVIKNTPFWRAGRDSPSGPPSRGKMCDLPELLWTCNEAHVSGYS